MLNDMLLSTQHMWVDGAAMVLERCAGHAFHDLRLVLRHQVAPFRRHRPSEVIVTGSRQVTSTQGHTYIRLPHRWQAATCVGVPEPCNQFANVSFTATE